MKKSLLVIMVCALNSVNTSNQKFDLGADGNAVFAAGTTVFGAMQTGFNSMRLNRQISNLKSEIASANLSQEKSLKEQIASLQAGSLSATEDQKNELYKLLETRLKPFKELQEKDDAFRNLQVVSEEQRKLLLKELENNKLLLEEERKKNPFNKFIEQKKQQIAQLQRGIADYQQRIQKVGEDIQNKYNDMDATQIQTQKNKFEAEALQLFQIQNSLMVEKQGQEELLERYTQELKALEERMNSMDAIAQLLFQTDANKGVDQEKIKKELQKEYDLEMEAMRKEITEQQKQVQRQAQIDHERKQAELQNQIQSLQSVTGQTTTEKQQLALQVEQLNLQMKQRAIEYEQNQRELQKQKEELERMKDAQIIIPAEVVEVVTDNPELMAKIEDLQSQIADRDFTIQTLNNQVAQIRAESELAIQAIQNQMELQVKQTINQLEQQVLSANQEKTSLQKDYEDVVAENMNLLTAKENLETQLKQLQNQALKGAMVDVESQTENDLLEDENQKLSKQIENLTKQNQTLQRDNQTMQAQLDNVEGNMIDGNSRRQISPETLEAQQNQINDLQTQNQQLSSAITTLQNIFNQLNLTDEQLAKVKQLQGAQPAE